MKKLVWLLLLLALLGLGTLSLSGCDGCSGEDFCPIPNAVQVEGDAGA